MAKQETDVVNSIRLALSPYADLMRNNVGQAKINGNPFNYGLCVGSSDLIGLRRKDGKFIAIEVKTPSGRVSPEQEMFIQRIRASGGLAGVARTVEDALEILHSDEFSEVP